MVNGEWRMVNGNGKPFCHFSIQIKIMANGKW
jgi:hypothetical protein